MVHHLVWHNFHGWHELKLRGPAGGFRLSEGQAAKYRKEACGITGCKCHGQYGAGFSRGRYAWLQQDEDGSLWLYPAGDK